VQFRLWAPAAQQVALLLVHDDGDESIPMTSSADGWFETTVRHARAGSRYHYRIDDKLKRVRSRIALQPERCPRPSESLTASYTWKDKDWPVNLGNRGDYEIHSAIYSKYFPRRS